MYKSVEEQRLEDMAGFKEMMRMTYESFQEILAAIEPFFFFSFFFNSFIDHHTC